MAFRSLSQKISTYMAVSISACVASVLLGAGLLVMPIRYYRAAHVSVDPAEASYRAASSAYARYQLRRTRCDDLEKLNVLDHSEAFEAVERARLENCDDSHAAARAQIWSVLK
jgi:hypothetical protein